MSSFSIDHTLQKLQLKSPEAVFLLGSHLWGTVHPESDHDLIIVMKNYHGEHSLHLPQVDATVLSLKEFQQRVKKQEFLETICVLLPEEFRLSGKSAIKALSPKEFSQSKWQETILYRMQRDLAYANKNEAKGKLERASKTRFHALATLRLGIQVKHYYHHQEPIDFTCAQKYHQTFWTKAEFTQIYEELLQEFTS